MTTPGTPYRDVLTRESGLFEACARHTARNTTRALQTMYLCDNCTRRLVAEAFNQRPPVWHGETLNGFCGLCNERKQVTARMWFVCPICWNVVVAYQKSIAATKEVHSWWTQSVAPVIRDLELVETEQVYLSPFAKKSQTKKESAATLGVLDFCVSKRRDQALTPLFHIEQKTGPGSIEEMKEFQLDVNDFNDIAGVCQKTTLPSYVVHVQVVQEYDLPTRRSVVKGLWWTDVRRLEKNLKANRQRRGEDKRALYFKPDAFLPIDSFTEELEKKRYIALREDLNATPIKMV